jgi:hypothetical protein
VRRPSTPEDATSFGEAVEVRRSVGRRLAVVSDRRDEGDQDVTRVGPGRDDLDARRHRAIASRPACAESDLDPTVCVRPADGGDLVPDAAVDEPLRPRAGRLIDRPLDRPAGDSGVEVLLDAERLVSRRVDGCRLIDLGGQRGVNEERILGKFVDRRASVGPVGARDHDRKGGHDNDDHNGDDGQADGAEPGEAPPHRNEMVACTHATQCCRGQAIGRTSWIAMRGVTVTTYRVADITNGGDVPDINININLQDPDGIAAGKHLMRELVGAQLASPYPADITTSTDYEEKVLIEAWAPFIGRDVDIEHKVDLMAHALQQSVLEIMALLMSAAVARLAKDDPDAMKGALSDDPDEKEPAFTRVLNERKQVWLELVATEDDQAEQP